MLNLVDRFHDSCIKEMRYDSGAFVDADLSMKPVNTQRKLYMVIQRQAGDPSVIELAFSGLIELKLSPNDESCTSEMLEASMKLTDNGIFWCDCASAFESAASADACTRIHAQHLRWRAVDTYLGSDSIYINKS